MQKEEIITRIREIQGKIFEAQQKFNPTKAWDCIDQANGLLLELKLDLQSDNCPDVISSDDIELQGELLTDILTEFKKWREVTDVKIRDIVQLYSDLQNKTNHFVGWR